MYFNTKDNSIIDDDTWNYVISGAGLRVYNPFFTGFIYNIIVLYTTNIVWNVRKTDFPSLTGGCSIHDDDKNNFEIVIPMSRVDYKSYLLYNMNMKTIKTREIG
jgi:hypothetical protein